MLVPAIFVPTILSGVAITVLDGFDPGFVSLNTQNNPLQFADLAGSD